LFEIIFMDLIIGPSNGWLFRNGIISLDEQVDFFRKAGINAVEFVMTFDKARHDILKKDLGLDLKFISAHVPAFNKVDKSLKEHIELLKKVGNSKKFASIVIHPTDVPQEYWDFISENSFPVSVENMDKRAMQGWELEELKKLLDSHNVKLVFDVQHAFERDPTMEYAKKLFDLVKNMISHFHVSGEDSRYYHIMVHKADNKDAILDFLRYSLKIKNLPLILEGEYKTAEELKESIEFLRENLK